VGEEGIFFLGGVALPLCVFPFVPRHHMTGVRLLLPFISTVWTLVVFAIIK